MGRKKRGPRLPITLPGSKRPTSRQLQALALSTMYGEKGAAQLMGLAGPYSVKHLTGALYRNLELRPDSRPYVNRFQALELVGWLHIPDDYKSSRPPGVLARIIHYMRKRRGSETG